jgi:hypothetical protein
VGVNRKPHKVVTIIVAMSFLVNLVFFIFMLFMLFIFRILIPNWLPRHRNADDIAPSADALGGLEVAALAFPEGALAGEQHRFGKIHAQVSNAL